jgi:small membrane protein
MIIRPILTIVIAAILIWFLTQNTPTKRQAAAKLSILTLLVFAIFAVLFPNSTNDVAHAVGVGRGADLLLYCVTLVFLVSLLTQYIHRQKDQKKVVMIARKVAILQAYHDEHNKKVLKNYSKK